MRGRLRFAIALMLLASCLCSGCAKKQKRYEKMALYFDTVIQITFYADENGDDLMAHCMEMCENYEKIFSRTREDSELYQINHRRTDQVQVSDEVAELVAVGLEYYEKSGGKFDITVAPLFDVWDFKSEAATAPPAEKIAEALAKVDASAIHLDGNTLIFDREDTMLDLGALAKGYAADQMRAYLKENGVVSGILNLGGNVLTIGGRADGKPWKIGIQKPFAAQGETAATTETKEGAVVSSGIYERYFEEQGVIYHHILDPENGYPIQNDLWGVTILCESSLVGDALSTTCLTLGADEAEKLIASMEGVEAIFIKDDQSLVYTGKQEKAGKK